MANSLWRPLMGEAKRRILFNVYSLQDILYNVLREPLLEFVEADYVVFFLCNNRVCAIYSDQQTISHQTQCIRTYIKRSGAITINIPNTEHCF